MKKKLFLFISLLILSITIQSKNTLTIKVGLYNNPPKIYLNEQQNTPAGFWADITTYIAKQENWKLNWEFGTWQECMAKLKNNQLDIMVDVGVTPEREKIYKFNKETVLISWVRLYKKKGSEINSITDLEGKKVAALKGSFDLNGPEGLIATLKKFGVNSKIIEMNSYEDIFNALQNKEIDAGITDADYGNLNAKKYKIDTTFLLFQPAHMKYAFPKNSKFADLLIERIDHHLKSMKKNRNSIYYKALDKYLIGAKQIKVVPKHLKFFVFSIILFLLILFIFNVMLKNQVKKKTKQLKEDLDKIKAAEEKINHLNSILISIRDVNQLIAREKDRDQLIKNICKNIITKSKGYKRGWTALFNKNLKLKTLATAGLDDIEDELRKILLHKTPNRLKRILNSNKIDIINQPTEECKDCEIANHCRNETLMAIKIATKKSLGIFCVSIQNTNLFSNDEKALFEDLSQDISFALNNIEIEIEKAKTEKKLFESEARYRAIVEQSFEGISLFDLKEYKIIDANKAYQEMLGYSLEELKNIQVSKIVANPQIMKEKINEIMNSERVIISECKLLKKDGTILNAEVSNRLIHYRNKQIILSVIRDITEKKKIENELKKSEEKYRLLAQSIPDIIIVIDLNGKITYVNPNAIKISQLKEDEILGQHFSKFIEPAFLETILKKLKMRKSGVTNISRYEVMLTNTKGLIKPYELTSTPIIEDGQITKILVIGHDISDRKKKMKLIKKSLEEKEILLKELYHRTKNNMQIISSMISIQARKYKNPEIRKSFMEIMNKIHAMALVHQKLYEAKNLSQINLKNYINDLFTLLKESYASSNSQIEATLDLEDCFIGIEPALNLGLVLNELITNIFKYGLSKDNITKIYIGLKRNDNIIDLRIEDSGEINQDIDLREIKSMGLRTVFSLVEYKLKGKIDYKIDNGLKWHIQFKIKN